METIKVQRNQLIAKQKDMVRKWYIVLEGSVVQMNSYARILLEKNSVIGISESGRYLCDYVAREDSTLAVFNYESPDDLKTFERTGKSAESDASRCIKAETYAS